MVLFFIFFFIGSASKVKVAIHGFVPTQLTNQKFTIISKNEAPDYHIIPQPSLLNKPKKSTLLCKFWSQYPKYFIFEKNETTTPLVSIDPKELGSFEISQLLFSRSISVALYVENCTFILSQNHDLNISGYIMSNNSIFDFIQKETIQFHLYGGKRGIFSQNVCKTFQNNIQWMTTIETTIFLLIVFVFIFLKFTKPLHFNNIPIWFYNNEGACFSGPDLNTIDEISRRYIVICTKRAIKYHRNITFIISIVRYANIHAYKRVYCRAVNNGFFITFLFTEFFADPVPVNLDYEFISDTNELTSTPEMKFTTFQNYRPFNLSYYLKNDVFCRDQLPAIIFAPFQPSGRIITVIVSMLFKLTSNLIENPFIETNFAEMVNYCYQQLVVSSAFFFNEADKLIYSIQKDNHIPPNIIKNLPTKVKKVSSSTFMHSLIDEGDSCFIMYTNEVLAIIQYDTNMESSAFSEMALPLMTQCCTFVYHLSKVKKASLKFRRFISTMVDTEIFSLFEKQIPSNMIRQFTTINDSTLAHKIFDFVNEIKIPTQNHIFEITEGSLNWVSATADVSLTDDNNSILSVLIENIFQLKKQFEFDVSGMYLDLLRPIPILGLQKFTIVTGRALLESRDVFVQLNREPKDGYWLDEITHPNDVGCLDYLTSPSKVAFRLSGAENNPHWYGFASNGSIGFLFPISEIIDMYNTMQTADKNLQLAASGSSLIFWCVDPVEDTVHPMLMQPTIWDSLNVDHDTKFSKFIDFIDDEDKDLYRKKMDDLLSGKVNNWSAELRIVRSAGQHEWNHIVIARSKNKVLQCLALNVNKQKENEMKLRETQNLRDLLLTSGKLTLWKFNDDYKPIQRMSHFDPGINSTVEMNWTFVDTQVHPDYRQFFHEKMDHALEFDECFEMSVPLLFDEEMWVSVRGKAHSSTRQVVGVCIDITELQNAYSALEKEKKRAEEANKQKTVFLANMSHEIRTPMNGIFGILDVLALRDLSSEQRQLVETIHASSMQLMKLLNDTLNLSKIEQGDIESSPTIFHIGKILEPICVAASSRAKSNNITFHVTTHTNVPQLVFGDSQLFSQILNNLLSNSLKFTKKGYIDVDVYWTNGKDIIENNDDNKNYDSDDYDDYDDDYDDNYADNNMNENDYNDNVEDDEYLILTVKDTGIGVSKEQRKNLFKRFQQAEASTARYYGGTGLGLALVQEIIRFLGGGISLRSKLGEGSKFTVKIPMESLYYYISLEFSDKKDHIVMISMLDNTRLKMIEEWLIFLKYKSVVFTKKEEILPNSEIIFIESQKELAKEVNDMKLSAVLCALSNPGEKSVLPHNLIMPVLPYRLIDFVNDCRYRKEKVAPREIRQKVEAEEKHILVVEDNTNNQYVMKKILQNLGCSFMLAENGKVALELMENNRFDLVFMDCQMPVMDGIKATQLIRQSKTYYSNVPIIALTASAVEGDEQTCLEAGMNDYLAKPVRLRQISAMIQKFTGNKSPDDVH